MSSLNYKLAGFLIVLMVLSGMAFILAFYLRNFKPESTLGRQFTKLSVNEDALPPVEPSDKCF